MVAEEKNYICRFTGLSEVLKQKMHGSTGGNETKKTVGLL
jgi:hypothetical protein